VPIKVKEEGSHQIGGEELRIGIIGCGGIAPAHIRVYQKLRDVEVVGLCDLNVDRAKQLATAFRIEKAYSNYVDMLERERLDLVDICTPVSTHARIVCDVAKSVQAILVEKPMAMNVLECDQIIDEVKRRGTKICIGQSQTFSPNIEKAKKIVDSGKFDLFCFSTIQKESFEVLKAYNLAPAWNVSPEQKGIIWEVCCHLAYLQLYFLPEIKEVYAVGDKVKYPVYDDFAVLLRTSGQRFGIIELSWLSRETETIYELSDTTGKRMQIHWEFDYFLENTFEPPFTVARAVKNVFVDEKRLLQKWASFGMAYFRKRKLLPTFNLINRYIESIKNDLPSPVSAQDGRNTINLLECIEKSLDEKRPVAMNT
jgi:predicted dehydrogenase